MAPSSPYRLSFALVRTAAQLAACSALIIPGGESMTMALVAERSGLLEPLREFIKVDLGHLRGHDPAGRVGQPHQARRPGAHRRPGRARQPQPL